MDTNLPTENINPAPVYGTQGDYYPDSYGNAYIFGNMSGMPKQETFKDIYEWYKAVAAYFVRKSYTRIQRRMVMNKICIDAYNAYTGNSQVPQYASGDGSTSKGDVSFEYMNSIFRHFNILIGEQAAKGYDVSVEVNNQTAISRREEAETKIFIEKLVRSQFPDAAALDIDIPEDSEKFNLHVKDLEGMGYKDIVASAGERLLNDWMRRVRFDEWALQTYRYYVLTGVAVACPEIDMNTFDVTMRIVDPALYYYDTDCQDDYFTRSQYYFEFRWMPPSDILTEFPHLSPEQIRTLMGPRMYLAGVPIYNKGYSQDMILTARLKFIYTENVEGQIDRLSEIAFEELNGKLEAQYSNETEKVPYRYQTLHDVVLVGNNVVARGGIYPFQLRDVEKPAITQHNSECLVYNFALDPNSPPLAMRIIGLQHYRNMLLFKVMEVASQIRGVVVEIDTSRIFNWGEGDTKEDFERLMYNYTANKVILKDSSQDNGGAGGDVIKLHVAGDASQVAPLLQYVEYIDKELQEIIGMNASRTGAIGKYETSTNALMNKTQSDLATAHMNISFDNFIERTLQKVLNMLKISYYLKLNTGVLDDMAMKSLQLRLGDDTIAVLKDEQLLFEEMSVRVKKNPYTRQDRLNKLNELAMVGLQAQALSFEEAADIILMTDPDDAKNKLLRNARLKALKQQQEMEMQAQQAQQLQAQQLQAQQAMQQQQQGFELQKGQMDAQNQMAVDAVKNAAQPIQAAVQGASNRIQNNIEQSKLF